MTAVTYPTCIGGSAVLPAHTSEGSGSDVLRRHWQIMRASFGIEFASTARLTRCTRYSERTRMILVISKRNHAAGMFQARLVLASGHMAECR